MFLLVGTVPARIDGAGQPDLQYEVTGVDNSCRRGHDSSDE